MKAENIPSELIFDLIEQYSWSEIPVEQKALLPEDFTEADFNQLKVTHVMLYENSHRNESIKAPDAISHKLFAVETKKPNSKRVMHFIQIATAIAACLVVGIWLTGKHDTNTPTFSVALNDSIEQVHDISKAVLHDTVVLFQATLDAQQEKAATIQITELALYNDLLSARNNFEAIADATSLVSTQSILTRIVLTRRGNWSSDSIGMRPIQL